MRRSYVITYHPDCISVCLKAPEDEAALPDAEPEDDMKDEVMVFKDNCPSCNAPCDTNMKMIGTSNVTLCDTNVKMIGMSNAYLQ